MNIKTIYIFLGSSIVEFKNEREELSNFIHEMSSSCFEEQYDVRIKPLTCNHSDQSMSIGGKQKAINEALKECDYCFFIFGSKAGEKTVEEIKVAYAAFKEFQVKPKIYVFFREQEEDTIDQSINECKALLDQEYKHYYQIFKDTDTIKLQIILALNSNKTTTNFNIAIQEGELLLDNKRVTGLDLSKTNTFAVDKDLLSIKEEIRKTDIEYYRLRELMKESDSDIYDEEYAKILSKRRELRKKENEISKQLLDIALKMSEDIANGEMSPRLEEAYRLLEKGNKEECLKILNPEESQADFLKNERLLKAQAMILKNELKKNADTRVKEALLYAKVSLSTAKNDDDFRHILEELNSVLPVVKEYEVGFDVFSSIAAIHYQLVEYHNSLNVLEDGIEFLEEIGQNESQIYFNLWKYKSFVYLALGDFNKQIDCLESILDKYDEINNKTDEVDNALEIEYANVLLSIASVAVILAQGETAIEYASDALQVLEGLDESLAIVPIIRALSCLALAYYSAKEMDELDDVLLEAKGLIAKAKESDIEDSAYFESYMRLLIIEAYSQIFQHHLKKGMSLYAKYEKEAEENRDWFKETNYTTNRFLINKDMASALVVAGYYKEAIKAYRKMASLPTSENNVAGVATDLTYAYTCLGGLDVVVTAYMNDETIAEGETRQDIKEFINNSLDAIDILEKNIASNPTVISVNLAKAYCELLILIEIMEKEPHEMFTFAKKAIYYAKQCALYPEINIQYQCGASSLLIVKYYEYGFALDNNEAKTIHQELIEEYTKSLFAFIDENYETVASVYNLDEILYILELLSEYNEPFFEQISKEYEDLIDLLSDDEDEEDED